MSSVNRGASSTRARISRTDRLAEMLAIAVASLLAIGMISSMRDDAQNRPKSGRNSPSTMDGGSSLPSDRPDETYPEDTTERQPGADQGHENHGAIYGGP